MTRRRLCTWPVGLVARCRAFAVSATLLLPGACPSLLSQLLPALDNAGALDTAAMQRVICLLEGLQEEQAQLSNAIARLGAGQTDALERQVGAARRHQTALVDRFSAERNHHQQFLEDLGRLAVTVLLSVAGVVLLAMAGLAWSLLRALQRLPVRSLLPAPIVAGRDEVGLPVFMDPQLLGALTELEKRLLKLGESVNASGMSRKTPKLEDSPALVPGDFL